MLLTLVPTSTSAYIIFYLLQLLKLQLKLLDLLQLLLAVISTQYHRRLRESFRVGGLVVGMGGMETEDGGGIVGGESLVAGLVGVELEEGEGILLDVEVLFVV